MSIETIKIPLTTASIKPFIKQGDTIPEWSVEFEEDDNIDLTGAVIKMQLFSSSTKYIDVSSTAGITINNALKFTVDERSSTEPILPQGLLKGDIEVLFADGTKKTLFNVEYTIEKQYTK